MSTTSLNQTYRIRERQTRLGLAVEAIRAGETYPFVQAHQHQDRWLVMTAPEIARDADCGMRFAPTFTVWSHDDARKWVELLAALHTRTAVAA
ncbi:hypothetical protein [Mycobacterium palustre]|uniref:Uncharacterized protein n=1 Tax=Mycobacterium palustre TaxID=153971 RepID=A0A1X1ZC00_9MYCO|nr:hypothetical protein [Mycobacterium palustre]MCV7100047.1 hypothetical protein [Mycobacterium palustre]ORW20937.1 hypothetical protein AWC19_14330 [Mycobacterium palustre]